MNSTASTGPTPPKISIVTPSLNQGRFIRCAIQSVLDQNYPELEYLVMDGKSKDDSCAVAAEFSSRLRLVSEKDDGQSDAINKGFSKVSGDIIGWLNADDFYAAGVLEQVAAIFAAHPDVVLVYGLAEYVDEVKAPIGPAEHIEPFDGNRLLSTGDFIVQPAAFFRRKAFLEVGGLRKDLHWTMDYDLWIRLGKHGKAIHVPETFAYVRCYPDTKTASGGRRRLAEVESMVRSHHGAGLPAYFQLEAAALDFKEALQCLRRLEIKRAAGMIGSLTGRLCSARTVRALLSARTWRVVRAALRRDARMAKP